MDAVGRLFLNRRSAALLFLGFSSGLPNTTLTSTFNFWLTDAGCTESQIGLLSFAALPYSAKFLWAPLVDNRRPPWPRGWGRRRAWILAMQAALTAVLAIAAFAGPWGRVDAATSTDARGIDATMLVWMLVGVGTLMAFLSATQDISVDAHRADVSTDETRAACASMSVSGYRLAAAGVGAGAIYLAKRLGSSAAMGLTALLMLFCTAGTLIAPDPPEDRAPRRSFGEAVIAPLRSLASRLGHRAWLVAVFVILFKLPDTLPLAMVQPFLLRHMGYDSDDVATLRTAVGLGLSIVGAIVGAAIVPRLGMRRSLLLFGALQALSTGAFAVLALARIPADPGGGLSHWLAPPTLALLATVIVEYFCAGLVTAGFVAYLMWLCDRRWSATHYALLTSVVALGTAIAGAGGGWLIEGMKASMGDDRAWTAFFGVAVLSGLPALVLVPFVTKRGLGAAH